MIKPGPEVKRCWWDDSVVRICRDTLMNSPGWIRDNRLWKETSNISRRFLYVSPYPPHTLSFNPNSLSSHAVSSNLPNATPLPTKFLSLHTTLSSCPHSSPSSSLIPTPTALNVLNNIKNSPIMTRNYPNCMLHSICMNSAPIFALQYSAGHWPQLSYPLIWRS